MMNQRSTLPKYSNFQTIQQVISLPFFFKMLRNSFLIGRPLFIFKYIQYSYVLFDASMLKFLSWI